MIIDFKSTKVTGVYSDQKFASRRLVGIGRIVEQIIDSHEILFVEALQHHKHVVLIGRVDIRRCRILRRTEIRGKLGKGRTMIV